MKLMDYFLDFVQALRLQLDDDQVRWGDEWKNRPIEPTEKWNHQNQRNFNRIREYYMDWYANDIPIPWLKICGNCFIAWVRERNPDTYNE